MLPIDPSLFQSALPAQDLVDEAVLGLNVGPGSSGPRNAAPGPRQSPQEQALSTLLSLTSASQAKLNTEAFYGVPATLRETQGMVDTLVNAMSASVTQYAATAQELSGDRVFALLRG